MKDNHHVKYYVGTALVVKQWQTVPYLLTVWDKRVFFLVC